MSDITLRLAEACERAARYASFVEAMSDDMEQRITARNDVAEYRALAAALRGAKPVPMSRCLKPTFILELEDA